MQLATVLADADHDIDIRVFRSFEPVRNAWIDLQQEAHCLGFQDYRWVTAVWQIVGRSRPGRLAIVLVSDAAGKPMMLLPLVERRQGGIRILEFIDFELSDYNAPLIRREFLQTLGQDPGRGGFERLWQVILDRVGRVDVVRLEKMPPLVDGIENPFLQLDVQKAHVTFQATLANGFDAFVKGRSAHFMRNLRRGRRNLEKLGKVELRNVTDPDEALRTLDEMIKHKSIRCKAMGARNIFETDPGYIEFYREMCRREVGGLICAGSLKVEDRMVASHLGLVFRGRFYGLIQASDFENFSTYSPGGLMLLELIKWCCDRGIQVFDFSIGSEAYKVDWTDATMPLYRHDRGLTVLGKLVSARHGGYARLKVIVKDNPRLLTPLKKIRTKLKGMRTMLAGS